MPLKPTKNLLSANEEILKLVDLIFKKDSDPFIERFFDTSSLLNISKLAKTEANLTTQTLMFFYGYFFTICHRFFLAKQRSATIKTSSELSSFEVSMEPLLTVNVIGNLIKTALQPFTRTQKKHKGAKALDLADLLEVSAFKEALQVLFDFTTLNEDHWKVLDTLKFLILDISQNPPPPYSGRKRCSLCH